MRVLGATKLRKQLRKIPNEVRAEIVVAIRRNADAGARMARQLVPVDKGELKGWIHTKFDMDGMSGSIEAAPPTAEAQKKARAVEFGRKKGNRGTTNAKPYMRIMQRHMAKRFKQSIRTALRKAARRVVSGG